MENLTTASGTSSRTSGSLLASMLLALALVACGDSGSSDNDSGSDAKHGADGGAKSRGPAGSVNPNAYGPATLQPDQARSVTVYYHPPADPGGEQPLRPDNSPAPSSQPEETE